MTASSLLCLSLLVGFANAFQGCPCVQDYVKFYFDLKKGCSNHAVDNPIDFTNMLCNVYYSNTRVDTVKIYESQQKDKNATVTLVHEEEAEETGARTFFEYYRRVDAPSMLAVDFLSRSNTLLASIDLVYDTNNHDCVLAKNPIYWPKDQLYFLTVVSSTRMQCVLYCSSSFLQHSENKTCMLYRTP